MHLFLMGAAMARLCRGRTWRAADSIVSGEDWWFINLLVVEFEEINDLSIF